MAPHAEQIPAEPFARWLNERLGQLTASRADGDIKAASARLAEELGWMGGNADAGYRKLYRFRKQLKAGSKGSKKGEFHTDSFPRSTVEEALFNAGVSFEDLYPEIAARETIVLEPDQWCLRCEESKTPINGRCPFCETQIGPETGQALQGKLRAA